MTSLLYYPRALMRERSMLWALSGTVISPGQTAGGVMPATRLDGGGLWKSTMSDVPLWTGDQVRAWRALAAIADGGAQPIVVPMDDRRFFPAPVVAGVRLSTLPLVPHSDSAPFSDGTEYRSDVVNASLNDDADLRDTEITIKLAVGSSLRGGEYFSIDHDTMRWRLYILRTAVDNGDGTFDCTIRPPLREDALAGTALQFDQPKCVMRVATSDAMDVSLDLRRLGKPSVSFIEAFPPFPT